MAGRPSGGSGTGILVGMIVAVAVALVALVMLVVLWNNQEDLKAERDKANRIADRLMRSGEMQSSMKAWLDQVGDGRGQPSVAKLMSGELKRLGEMISSEVTDSDPGLADQLDKRINGFWDDVETDHADGRIEDPGSLVGAPLYDALSGLYQLYKQQHDTLTQARATIEDLNGQVAELTRLRTEMQEEFANTTEELRTQLAAVEDDRSEFRHQKVTEFEDIAKAAKDREEMFTSEKQELRSELQTLAQELDKKEAKNKELQSKVKEFQILPQPRMAARQADGQVLMAKAGQPSVFVNLGVDDRLVLGLRFAVYPPDSGIPSSGLAKAQIEVVSIGQEVSECRIVWDDALFPIIAGDLVANPIYDSDRSQLFHVIGGFDLDYDNRDDPNGRQIIEAVIRQYGGTISPDINPRVDFVVVGARPLVRRLSSNPSEEEVVLHDEEQRAAEQFDAVMNEALQLSIPVFTQETFLNFLGRRQ